MPLQPGPDPIPVEDLQQEPPPPDPPRAGLSIEELTALFHEELRLIARRLLTGERRDHSLGSIDLANEAFLRLNGSKARQWSNRTDFLGIARHVMKQVLIDHARRRRRLKRGGDLQRIALDENSLPAPSTTAEFSADDFEPLTGALDRLHQRYRRAAMVVELRIVEEQTIAEVAKRLSISERQVCRDWRLGQAFLLAELTRERD